MIEVRSLTKKYGERLAVDDVSFAVQRGEILGFLGQNGAGKTTTMKILTCFMPASSGTATVAGFDVFEKPLEVKKRIGYLPEIPPVYPELLVSEYLSFVAELKRIPRSERPRKIDRVLERCNLGSVRKRLIGNLSKGYRQRVGLAQALIHDPEVLILDEPTIGLDPKQVTEIRSLIKSMRSERTVIYSTHILSEVAATCDRIVIIDQGRIVAQEAISALSSAGGTTKTEIVVQRMSDQVLRALRDIKGVSNVQPFSNGAHRIVVESEAREDLMAEMSQVVVNQKAGLIRMSPVQLALEEYYLNLIGGRRDMQ
ncbi:MAG: ATP-binding cassette domain-containing protein [Deltaproteobacteria bacterium]|nr:ATP-binding cassette domain-containing protein [Deltaproteobacteria bacterium]